MKINFSFGCFFWASNSPLGINFRVQKVAFIALHLINFEVIDIQLVEIIDVQLWWCIFYPCRCVTYWFWIDLLDYYPMLHITRVYLCPFCFSVLPVSCLITYYVVLCFHVVSCRVSLSYWVVPRHCSIVCYVILIFLKKKLNTVRLKHMFKTVPCCFVPCWIAVSCRT
jgi:hypothetical protein